MVYRTVNHQPSAIIPLSIISLVVTVGLCLTAPVIGYAEPETTFPFAYNTSVAQMMGAVQSSDVSNYGGYLSGQFPVTVGGLSVTLTSRNLYDPHLAQATQYVFEFMQARGLSVRYDPWNNFGASGRNIVGVITGTLYPEQVVLITAHLDDMPETGIAPGADDNASGSVGVMLAAARLAGHKFSRTLRFIFFTGEEYDENGSYAYAQAALAQNEKLVAVFNMDMIGWDGNKDGVIYLETRVASDPGYADDLAITTVFTRVVNTYGLQTALHPNVDAISDHYVDSWSFWRIGYPSVTAIEDWDEGHPYYHTGNDTLSTLNLTFFTNFVKASVGTAAHLAMPMDNKIYLPLILKSLGYKGAR